MLGYQCFLLLHIGWALEQGKYVVVVKKDQLARIPKNLYKGSDIRLSINATCAGKDKAAGKVTANHTSYLSIYFNHKHI